MPLRKAGPLSLIVRRPATSLIPLPPGGLSMSRSHPVSDDAMNELYRGAQILTLTQ